jgi:hypothetical protein
MPTQQPESVLLNALELKDSLLTQAISSVLPNVQWAIMEIQLIGYAF